MSRHGGGHRPWKSRGLAALFGLAFALAATELLLRSFLPQPLGLSYLAPSGLTLHIPGASIRYRRSEFDTAVHVNAIGLRDREIAVPKPAGVFRILVLGDSYVEGKQVALDETFPKLLERGLQDRFPQRRWEVVNGGVSGYGTADEIKFFEEIGRTLDPELVILAYCIGNDVRNNVASPYFRLRGERLEELPLEPPRPSALWLARVQEFGASRSHLYQFVRDRYHGTIASDVLDESPNAVPVQVVADFDEQGWRLTEALLDRLRERVDGAGARLFLVAIPQRAQVFDEEWVASTGLDPGSPERLAPQIRFATYARQRLQPFLDLLTDLHDASTRARTYFRVDGHFNTLGHRVTAQAILESLVKFNLVGDTR